MEYSAHYGLHYTILDIFQWAKALVCFCSANCSIRWVSEDKTPPQSPLQAGPSSQSLVGAALVGRPLHQEQSHCLRHESAGAHAGEVVDAGGVLPEVTIHLGSDNAT